MEVLAAQGKLYRNREPVPLVVRGAGQAMATIVLGFEVNDKSTHCDEQRTMMIFSLLFGWSEEADDAMRIKGVSGTTRLRVARSVSFARSTGETPKSTTGLIHSYERCKSRLLPSQSSVYPTAACLSEPKK